MAPIFLEERDQIYSLGALALGNFDGVHLGHRRLIKKSALISKDLFLPSAVLTFAPHPKEFFQKEKGGFKRIYSLEQNSFLLKKLGTDLVFVHKFDLSCSELSAVDFLDQIFKRIKFKSLVVGFDFKLGKGRGGDAKTLQNWCLKRGLGFYVVEKQTLEGIKVSSTRIKEALSSGRLKEAAKMLGEPVHILGGVVKDQGIGKKIGFPTLNIKLPKNLALPKGVYQSEVFLKEKKYKSISNLGWRPTFHKEEKCLTLESHILEPFKESDSDFSKIRVNFLQYLRPEKAFSRKEYLIEQVQKDISLAKSLHEL